MGKEGSPNNFWGAVVGGDTGRVTLTTDTGVNPTRDVKQGAFGGNAMLTGNANPFTRPQTGTLTFTDVNNNVVATRKVNLAFDGYIPVFYVNVTDSVTTIDHTFPSGPAMISIPLHPLK